MTTKLAVYNKALHHIGERPLASLSENREPRRALDVWWSVDAFLEQGLWRFARRTVKLEYSPSVEPDFGYRRAFDHPEDFIRTAMLCSDEYFKCPLHEYTSEAGFWYADLDTIYVAYISNHVDYGADLSLWPTSFENWVASWLAEKICVRITGKDDKLKEVRGLEKRLLMEARSHDAMEEPTKMPPSGTWVNSRAGYPRNRGRNRNSLMG